ncbi:MAG: hypothetical protein MHM6MM_006238 [Cercozoa sp. M6MM]
MEELGHAGTELVREMQRADWVPVFNDRLVREAQAQLTKLAARAEQEATRFHAEEHSQDEETRSRRIRQVYTLQRAVEFNRRCLVAYQKNRLDRIEETWWMDGGHLDDESVERLAVTEQEHFRSFGALLQKYMDSIDIDLTTDMSPPNATRVAVRVLEDCGTLQTDTGVVTLRKGNRLFLPRDNVEILVRQGKVRQCGQTSGAR